MKCPNCKNEIFDDALYCSHCGMKLERCKQCGSILQTEAHYCSHCGKPVFENKTEYQPINTEHFNRLGGYYKPLSEIYHDEDVYEKEEYQQETVEFNNISTNKKVNKGLIIFSVLALVVSTALAWGYLSKTGDIDPFTPNNNVNADPIKVTGHTELYTIVGNNNQGGHVSVYNDRVYVCDDEGKLVSMSTSFDDRKVLTDHKVEYVSVINDRIYYVNQDMKICSMDLNGDNQTVIVNSAAYYVNVVDSKIYYQSDKDGERLYVFDLLTLENKELNQRVTYNINVGEDKIYYTSTDGIYCIGKDGQGEEKLSADNGFALILRDHKLYYSTTAYESKVLDLNTKTSYSFIKERSSFLNMTSDYIFYYSASGLKKYDMKTKETQVIYSGQLQFVEIVANVLIITDTNGKRYVTDFEGQNLQRLFLSGEQNFV